MEKPHTTPVPNVIFDIYMKELNSTELKVLLVVIRQTLGWADRRGMYGRKEVDWISGSQLIQKTGCSKRAITSAVDLLVQKKLIEVFDDRGIVLNDPMKRQGKYRLYYGIHSSVYKPVDKPEYYDPTCANFAQDISKKCTALVQKMRITKETLQN